MVVRTVPAIVIDNGSCTSKVGYAGDDDPRIIFRSIVGHPKHHDASAGKSSLQCYIGDDAEVKRSDLDFIHPIENGIVTNWDDMEKVMEISRKKSFPSYVYAGLLLTKNLIPHRRFGIIF